MTANTTDADEMSADRLRELVATLRAEAKSRRDLAEHAEANRDDWFATMPPEISAAWLAEAERLDQTVAAIEALAARLCEVEKERDAVRDERARRVREAVPNINDLKDPVAAMRIFSAMWVDAEKECAALQADRDALAAALKDCSDDLAEWVESHYAGTKDQYPSEMRRYQRDMTNVIAARALLPAPPAATEKDAT